MKILVIGAEGQLARSLVERAPSHANLELTAVGRPTIDLESPMSAARRIAQDRPDLVINAAAYTAVDQAEAEPEQAFRINAAAAGEIAEAAAGIGAALFQLSTDYVFDGRSHGPIAEDAPTGPLNLYGASKLAGEAAVRAANPAHLIIRTAWVFSPYARNFVTTLVAAAEQGKQLTVVDDQFGSPTSALDLADALLAVADRIAAKTAPALGRTFHFAGVGPTSWFGLAQAIMDELELQGRATAEVLPIPSAQWPSKAVRPAYSALDSTRFTKEFGIPAPQWRDSLAKTVERLTKPGKR